MRVRGEKVSAGSVGKNHVGDELVQTQPAI